MMKKRFLSLALALALCLGLLPTALASETASGDFIIKNGDLIKYVGSGGDVVIPDGVKRIYGSPEAFGWHGVFQNCKTITSVTIPDSVTVIGSSAFAGSSITEVVIPDSVTRIGASAFSKTSLSHITLPNRLNDIQFRAFYECKNLTSIELPASVTFIGEQAFYRCENLGSVVMLGDKIEFYDNAFESTLWDRQQREKGRWIILDDILLRHTDVDWEADIAIPDNITKIAGEAFSTVNLKRKEIKLTMPDSITEIGQYAFWNTSISEITLSSKLKKIGDGAFRESRYLTNIVIPDGVTELSNNLFDQCEKLASVNIPPYTTRIGDRAFAMCRNLSTDLVLPESLVEVGDRGFFQCESLKNITVLNPYATFGENVFEACPNLTLHGYKGSTTESYAKQYNIPFVPLDTAVTAPGFVTKDGLNILFTQGKRNDAGLSHRLEFTNTTDKPIQGSYALLTYHSPTQAQFFFFDLDIAPGQTVTMERNSMFYRLSQAKMLWVAFDSPQEKEAFIEDAPIQGTAALETGYYSVDFTEGPAFLRDTFGIQ